MTQLLLFMVKQFNFIFLGSLRCGKRFDEMGSKPMEFLALVLGHNQRESGNEGLWKEELEEVTAIDPHGPLPTAWGWEGGHFFVLTSPGGVAVDWFSKCFLLSLGWCQVDAENPSWHGRNSTYQMDLTVLSKPKDLGGSTSIFLKIWVPELSGE